MAALDGGRPKQVHCTWEEKKMARQRGYEKLWNYIRHDEEQTVQEMKVKASATKIEKGMQCKWCIYKHMLSLNRKKY